MNVYLQNLVNHVRLINFYKIGKLYCAEFTVPKGMFFADDIESFCKNHNFLIYEIDWVTDPTKLKLYFESDLSCDEISGILTDYFKML